MTLAELLIPKTPKRVEPEPSEQFGPEPRAKPARPTGKNVTGGELVFSKVNSWLDGIQPRQLRYKCRVGSSFRIWQIGMDR